MASLPEARTSIPATEQVGARYQLHEPIGQGGVAVVYGATDRQSGQRVALKRLQLKEAGQSTDHAQRAAQLFEREYRTLCEVAHPRIVSVYDYAIDEHGPYYTMELLDGGDLQQLAPLGWERACSIGMDVCSALSLLHSRRFVHRDVTTRNVRCTSDGQAKLIDFGAMIPMGPTRFVVGTPPFCAPEVVDRQPLDGRTDLFALGATLYYTLTGRHAYPARRFSGLRDAWHTPPAPPSELVEGIPQALDALVLDLLNTDAAARPGSAAEVMERLSGIGGVEVNEQLRVAQAYLTTPSLVGRERPMGRVQRALERAQERRGSTLLISGPSGVGRSRLVDASALAARIAGLAVLRAAATDEGEYGVAKALGRQLLLSEPELALKAARPHVGRMGHLLPELLSQIEGAELETFDNPQQERPKLQAALRQWLVGVSALKPLLLAIDDFHRIDEPSAALLALLSVQVQGHPLVLVASTQADAPVSAEAALNLLSNNAKQIKLRNLEAKATRALLASAFGEVPHLELLSDRLQGLSNGNPRDIMQLAQHLVERDAVRFRGGVWSLPEQIDPRDLPSSMSEAMAASLEGLEPSALQLGRCFALEADQRFDYEDCLQLCARDAGGQLERDLEDLIERNVLRGSDDGYELTQQGWVDVLLREGSELQELHLRLASTFERRGNAEVRAAQHRLKAGQKTEGLELLLKHAEDSRHVTDESPAAFLKYVDALPPDWMDTFDEAVALCDRLARPARESYVLRDRFTGMVGVINLADRRHLPVMVQQLKAWSGLQDWEQLPSDLEALPRLQKALEKAQQDYQAASEDERVMEPVAAIGELARVIVRVSGVIAANLDFDYLDDLPSLTPFVPLSPAIEVIDTVLRGMRARMTGHRDAIAIYARVLERTAQPDHGGLEGSHLLLLRLGIHSGMGLLKASMGMPSCLEHAQACEEDAFYQLNALQIRAVHALWQGDVVAAERYRKEVERRRIENAAYAFLEGTHLVWEIMVHALCDDLTRTKETLRAIEELAEQYPDWRPVRDLGLAELHRIRGDYKEALKMIERGLEGAPPGRHQMWPSLAGSHLRTLLAQGDLEQAQALGRAYLQQAQQAELGFAINYVRMPLAEALSQLKLGEEAVALAQSTLQELQQAQCTGVNLALAYETRARVALALGDWEGLESYLEPCRKGYTARDNPVLKARLGRLERDIKRARVATESLEARKAAEARSHISDTELASQLAACDNAPERAEWALRQLVLRSGAERGVLYILDGSRLVRCALMGAEPPALMRRAMEVLEAELIIDATATGSTDCAPSLSPSDTSTQGTHTASGTQTDTSTQEGRFHPVLLSHPADGALAFTGVAMLWVAVDERFAYPATLARLVSERLHQAGDSSAQLVD